ncbi:MAG: radical SAM protein [Candidatus Cloacimonadota bacterium]|nr:radical SAM protein [Candidatus Cloacimonadota bacterium]
MKNIALLIKLILLRLFNKLTSKSILPISYTVSVTYRCNSRCKTCNIYKKKSEELSAKEYAKIFKKIGKSAYWITISGGEPFLKKDLYEIIQAIYKHSKPKVINIPTNGLLHNEIPTLVEKIAKNCPKSQIIINLSIDAIENQDDEIRGVKFAYSKAISTFRKLKKLKIENLNIGIHTVISKYNENNFQQIAGKLMSFEPDSYVTEIAENRVELGTMKYDISPSVMKYSQAIDYLLFHIKQMKFQGMNRITQTFRIEYYKMVKRLLVEQKQQIKCYAGILSAQIAPNGDVWPCCMKAVNVGNLKDFDYNFKKLWKKNETLNNELKKIVEESCYCPMANASYTNMLMNNKIMWKATKHFLFGSK